MLFRVLQHDGTRAAATTGSARGERTDHVPEHIRRATERARDKARREARVTARMLRDASAGVNA